MTAKKTYTQCEHERINSREYPGTRQLCYECDEPTGLCEDDGLLDEDGNWLCEECFALSKNLSLEN